MNSELIFKQNLAVFGRSESDIKACGFNDCAKVSVKKMKKIKCKTWKNKNNSPSPGYDIIFFLAKTYLIKCLNYLLKETHPTYSILHRIPFQNGQFLPIKCLKISQLGYLFQMHFWTPS